MKVHNDLNQLPTFRNSVLTIGSFDGVHLGHQKIIERLIQLAKEQNGESILITFHPHPRLVLQKSGPKMKLIHTIEEKVRQLGRMGLDHVVVVPFTKAFSEQSPEEYISNFLVEHFSPKYIVIGYDHRFGKNRAGDLTLLQGYAKQYGYQVEEISKQEIKDVGISSTKIRKAVNAGNLEEANALLGHTFLLSGTVEFGQQIGKTLGFPTANLKLNDSNKLTPPNGIYAVIVNYQNEQYGGMLYIGDRPSLKEFNNRTIEVNIFDFDKSIYGDRIDLEIIKHIREDQSFSNLQDLSDQLAKDKEASLKIIEELAPLGKTIQKDDPLVAIVILNYNGRQFLADFLPSVIATSYSNFEIVVADNGSTDDSIAFMQSEFPEIRLLDLEDNTGFAGGYNNALKQVEADYYVLLNSDVEVSENWLDPIIELMERDQTVAACQPKVRAYHQKEYFEYAGASGGWLDKYGYPFCRGRIFAVTELDEGQYDNTQEIFWATGAALFIRANLFHAIGAFDADFFAHAEEIDLCWRLKRAGYKIMVRPKSVVYHVGGGTLNYTTPRKTYLNFRNSLFTILKNEQKHKLYWLIPLRLLLDGLAAFLFLAQGRIIHIRAIFRAHMAFYANFRKMLKKRKEYQELIDRVSISQESNMTAQYQSSIVWKYYAQRRRSFKDL